MSLETSGSDAGSLKTSTSTLQHVLALPPFPWRSRTSFLFNIVFTQTEPISIHFDKPMPSSHECNPLNVTTPHPSSPHPPHYIFCMEKNIPNKKVAENDVRNQAMMKRKVTETTTDTFKHRIASLSNSRAVGSDDDST